MSTFIIICIDDYKKPRVSTHQGQIYPFSRKKATKCLTREQTLEEVGKRLDQVGVIWKTNSELEATHEKMFGKKYED